MHKKVSDLPKSIRPREKLEKLGVDNLTNEELLALLLSTGTKKTNVINLSKNLLNQIKLKGLKQTTLAQLSTINGVGKVKATKILAAVELGKRLFSPSSLNKVTVENTQDVINEVSQIASKKQEHIIVLYLNARHELIQKEIVALGKVNSALIEPKEVLGPALTTPCTGFIIAHNHPSNDPTPSREDIQFTVRLQKAAEIVGIDMIDHLIVCESSYFSFKEAKIKS